MLLYHSLDLILPRYENRKDAMTIVTNRMIDNLVGLPGDKSAIEEKTTVIPMITTDKVAIIEAFLSLNLTDSFSSDRLPMSWTVI